LTVDTAAGNVQLKNDITDNSWTNMTPTITGSPSARYIHAMAYDSQNNKVVLFGGFDGTNDGETWVYNYTDNSWTNMAPATSPSARYGHAMAYDSQNNKVVLFGGYDAGGYDGETWVYNYTDNTWTNMTPTITGSPSARRYHAMAYDSENKVTVLFGGYDGAYDDETWVYNYTDNSWTNVTPATSPSARRSHAMAYDSQNNKVVLFGGYDAGGYDGETWVYNYTDNTWTNMAPATSPSARSSHAMAYDSQNNLTVLFGGYGYNSTGDLDYLNDTWVYSYTDNSWTNMTPATSPSARYGHAMAYDSQNNKVVLFGGYDAGTYDDETWVYTLLFNYRLSGTLTSTNLLSGESDGIDIRSKCFCPCRNEFKGQVLE
jgi:N-acetylneuraminic acid mutarotase